MVDKVGGSKRNSPVNSTFLYLGSQATAIRTHLSLNFEDAVGHLLSSSMRASCATKMEVELYVYDLSKVCPPWVVAAPVVSADHFYYSSRVLLDR